MEGDLVEALILKVEQIGRGSSYRAKFILAFCPPLSDTPLSPTIVLSWYGNCLKSAFNAHTCITFLITIIKNMNIINVYIIILYCIVLRPSASRTRCFVVPKLRITRVLVERTIVHRTWKRCLPKAIILVKSLVTMNSVIQFNNINIIVITYTIFVEFSPKIEYNYL